MKKALERSSAFFILYVPSIETIRHPGSQRGTTEASAITSIINLEYLAL